MNTAALVSDICTCGFLRWARRRLRLLGYRVVFPRAYWRHDLLLSRYARRIGGIVVTRDKWFPKPRILVNSVKYEEAWTELCRALKTLRETRPQGEMCPVHHDANPVAAGLLVWLRPG